MTIAFRDYITTERRRSFQPPWIYLHVYKCPNCGRERRLNFHGRVPPGGFACDCEKDKT